MNEINYAPSWLDDANTLLEKLNKCIDKIVSIVTALTAADKTANDALSLAKTNEADIALNEADITELQGNVTRLNGDIAQLKTDVPVIEEKANRALAGAQAAQSTANSKQNPLYLHEITLKTISTPTFNLKFWVINEESVSYKAKFESEAEFNAILRPFNAKLTKYNEQSISACLTLQMTDISLSHAKSGSAWNPQNCNGTINFAAYLDTNNQIVTITDDPEWYGATINNDYVMQL